MEKKEQTKEEKEAEEKKMQNLQMEVLLSNSGIVGSNYAKSKGGELGVSSADNYMNGTDILKRKQEIYTQTKQMYKEAGVNYDAAFPTDGALVMNSMNVVQGAMSVLTLGNLEKIINTIDPTKAGIKISDKFKGITGQKLNEMVQKSGGKPSEELEDIYNTYHSLKSSYTKVSAMSVMAKNYLSDDKSVLDEIFNKYKPKEDKEGKKK